MLSVLEHPDGTNLFRQDDQNKKAEFSSNSDNSTSSESSKSRKGTDPPHFMLPGTRAMAGVLIKDWAERRVAIIPAGKAALHKGNL